ncbi:hypothetical protein HHI36_008695 [Cryptolaemus montrouzieri]|uniref:Reverse transcriptase n=1 Tax=Cryptolaemus montrouzieri TaxID=559131 RepID=A0ABD2MTA9_9CUCU
MAKKVGLGGDIGDLDQEADRKCEGLVRMQHRRSNYYFTQFLTGYGSYGTFTYGIKKTEMNKCSRCGKDDDREHVFCVCPRWAEERRALKERVITIPETTDIIAYMVEDERKGKTIFDYVVQIMNRKLEGEGV